MACCKACCGCADCAEGDQGKCCCGGSGGECCDVGEYCCSGACQGSPCDACGTCNWDYYYPGEGVPGRWEISFFTGGTADDLCPSGCECGDGPDYFPPADPGNEAALSVDWPCYAEEAP